jgi:hypothetical protein
MPDNTYDSENNGSGYADDFIPGKKNSYHPLNNVNNINDDIAQAFQEETGTDENGIGEGDDNTYDDAE